MSSLTFLLTDHHAPSRAALRTMVAAHPDWRVIAEAGDGLEATRLAAECAPDVLLLDIYMPGLKTVQVLRALREMPEPPRVLILTAYGDRENVLGMLRAGATGYLLKDEQPAVIAEAVRAVAGGKKWLSAAVAETLVEHVAEEGARPEPALSGAEGAPELSARELEVLRLLARGYSNARIAAGLGIAERTVRYHLRNIYDKLGVKGRGEAIARAAREGWGEEQQARE